MLSARTIYGEIFDNDEAFGCSAPSPPAGRQGGWEGHLGRILGWRRPTAAVLAAGTRGVYAYERLGGWRRMMALRMPARRNPLGGPVTAQPSHA